MLKSFLVLLFVTFVTTTYARSTALSTIKFHDDGFDNEIDRAPGPIMSEEKRLALETNEVKPEVPIHQDSLEVHQDDYQMEQPAAPKPSGLINQSKAPSTTFEYILDFLYGVCQWVYSKFFS